MNAEQKRCDRFVTVEITASRWTGETLMTERFVGSPAAAQAWLKWMANHPRFTLPPESHFDLRSPPNHRAMLRRG